MTPAEVRASTAPDVLLRFVGAALRCARQDGVSAEEYAAKELGILSAQAAVLLSVAQRTVVMRIVAEELARGEHVAEPRADWATSIREVERLYAVLCREVFERG